MLKRVLKKYFGIGLGERNLVLNFNLPEISPQLQIGSGSYRDLIKELNELEETPEQYFSMVWNITKYLNRCRMQKNQRIDFTKEIMQIFYPKAIENIIKLAQKNSSLADIPESEDRAQTLRYIAEISKVMAVSYQILFSQIYKSGNFRYARSYRIRQEYVSTILELFLLRQQALSLRYQILDDTDWHSINSLFYAMYHYHNEELYENWPTLNKQFGIEKGRNKISWNTLFCQIHLTGQFDMLHWPRHLQWVIASYVDGVKDAAIISLAGKEKLNRNQKIVYLSNPKMVLDFHNMNEAIRKDCMGLLQSQKKRDINLLPVRFARFMDTERFVVFNQLMRVTSNNMSQRDELKNGAEICDLRIYVGFNDVFSLLAHQNSPFAHEKRLADVLARRSAKIAEDHTVTETSLWLLVEQTSEMIRLSTEENNYTTRINLGSIVAYGIDDDEIKHPKLAVVSRIHRPNNKRVVIDLHMLANYAEPVLVALNNNPQKYKALLIYDIRRSGNWRIVLQPQNIAIGFDQLVIERKGEKIPITLETWHSATNDFYLYSITLTFADLGMSGEPHYKPKSWVANKLVIDVF